MNQKPLVQVLLNAEADYTATVHDAWRRLPPAKRPCSEAADIRGMQQTHLDKQAASNGIASQAAAASTAAAGHAAVQLVAIADAAAAAAEPADSTNHGAGGAAVPVTATDTAADGAPAAAPAALVEDGASGSRKWSRMWSFGSHRPSMPRRSVYAALIRERGLHLKPWRLVVTGHRCQQHLAACLHGLHAVMVLCSLVALAQ